MTAYDYIIQFNSYSNIIIKYNVIVLLVISIVKLVIKITIIEYSNEKFKPITCKREFNLRKSMKATGMKIKFKSIKFVINCKLSVITFDEYEYYKLNSRDWSPGK